MKRSARFRRLGGLALVAAWAAWPVGRGAGAAGVEEDVRLLREAFGRIERERDEARARWEEERRARQAAEAAAEEARNRTDAAAAAGRARRLEAEVERLRALSAGAGRVRELEARVESLEAALRQTASERDRLRREIGALRDSGGWETPLPAARARARAAAVAPERAPQRSAEAERILQAAAALLEAGEPDRAEAALRPLWQSGRPEAEELALLGRIEMMRARPREAVEALGAAARLAPGDTTVLKDLGLALHAAGFRDEAMRQFARVVQIDETDGEAHFNLAALHLMTSPPDVRQAARHYERALRLGEPRDDQLESVLFR